MIAACDKLLAADAASEVRFEQLLSRGYAGVRQERYAQAVGDFDRAVALNGESAFARHQRAYALNALGRHEAALVDLAIEERLLPEQPRVAEEQAYAHARLGDLVRARRDWDRAVTLAPDDRRTRLARAQAALWTGDLAQARADLSALKIVANVELAPSINILAERIDLWSHRSAAADPAAACRAAERNGAYAADGVIGDCTAAFQAAGKPSDKSAALSVRAMAWTVRGDPGAAFEDSEIAVALDPANPRWRASLGFHLLARQQLGDALLQFDEAVRLAPADAFSLAGRARARFEAGDDAGAARDARASIAQRPTELAQIVLGDVIYKGGDAVVARDAWVSARDLGARGEEIDGRLRMVGVAEAPKARTMR